MHNGIYSAQNNIVAKLVEIGRDALEEGRIGDYLELLAPLAPILGTALLRHAIAHPSNGIPGAWYHGLSPAFPQDSPEYLTYSLGLKNDGTTPTIEIILLRRPTLEQNPNEEWPNQLHFPGTTLRPGDQDAELTMRQRCLKEFDGASAVTSIRKIGDVYSDYTERTRGACHHNLFAVEIFKPDWLNGRTPRPGIEIYELEAVPRDQLVDHHRLFLEHFERWLLPQVAHIFR